VNMDYCSPRDGGPRTGEQPSHTRHIGRLNQTVNAERLNYSKHWSLQTVVGIRFGDGDVRGGRPGAARRHYGDGRARGAAHHSPLVTC